MYVEVILWMVIRRVKKSTYLWGTYEQKRRKIIFCVRGCDEEKNALVSVRFDTECQDEVHFVKCTKVKNPCISVVRASESAPA